MSNNDAHDLANLILADFVIIAPDLTEDQSKRMQAVIVGWAKRLTVVLR